MIIDSTKIDVTELFYDWLNGEKTILIWDYFILVDLI